MIMSSIKIHAQILDGNLGDSWKNNADAASAFAVFMEAKWRRDLAPLISEGYDININIDVQSKTTGASPDVSVWAEDIEMLERIQHLLTDELRLWEMFVRSPLAEALASSVFLDGQTG